MRSILKRTFSMFLLLSVLLSFAACGSEEAPVTTFEKVTETLEETEPTQSVTTEEVVTTPPVPTLPENMNPLTGLECDASLVGKRPLAVMLNNLKVALPQSGLSKCDIIYEVLAEGGIIRLEGILLDYANAGNLGSIRSARPYYVQIAASYDALYAHFGGSQPMAYDAIRRLGVNNMDGMAYDGVKLNGLDTFFRNRDRLNSGVPMEHTAFATGAGLAAIVANRGYRTDLNNKEFTAFSFDPAFAGIQNGTPATYVKIPHSDYSVSEFNYDAASGKYLHSQYSAPHVDGVDGAQVATENVWILFAAERVVDSYGRLEVTLTGEGSGYYLNGGVACPITWKRAGEGDMFRYYAADGTEMKVACGRSYISIVDTDTISHVTIS
ncbi:MAG: DUF3048 domain-containing protein [Clostridia bacterium]|nr:DUF3048 domain-containing protein [Clostridia bacterium]